MRQIFIQNGVLFYYGNPAGYLHGGTVILDSLFQKEELIRFIREKEQAEVEIREGVYDRLSEGGEIEEREAPKEGRTVKIYQLGQESPIMMRFVSLAERRKRGYAQPQREEYVLVYEGEIEKFDLEAVWDKFGRKVPADFKGHALSISDVIEFADGDTSRYFYVEPAGYEEIEFFKGNNQP